MEFLIGWVEWGAKKPSTSDDDQFGVAWFRRVSRRSNNGGADLMWHFLQTEPETSKPRNIRCLLSFSSISGAMQVHEISFSEADF